MIKTRIYNILLLKLRTTHKINILNLIENINDIQ